MRVKHVIWGVAVAALLVGANVAPAGAQQGGCKAEVERFCTGEKQVLACLKKNQQDLSPGCTTYVGIFEQIPSCLQEARTLCPTDNPTVPSLVGCLRGHQDKLSAECKGEIAKVK
jgi:hypothetical protein